MEESQSSNSAPISIQPKNVFGVQTTVRGNIHFTTKQEVIYPVAGVLAFHDYTTNKQKFLRFPENIILEIIVISPNRKLLGIAERNGEKSFVNVYELPSLKNLRSLTLPPDTPSMDISNMTFTYDSKALIAISKEPDSFVTIFYFDKNETILTGRVSNRNQKGLAKVLTANPNDSGLVAIGGDFTLKILNKTEKGFALLQAVRTENIIITSIGWLTADVLVAGTSDGYLLIVESGEPKAKMVAEEVEAIDLTKLSENEDPEKPVVLDYDTIPNTTDTDKEILNFTTFPKGFVFSIHNEVHVFEKLSSFNYIKKTINSIPISIYSKDLYRITNVAINMQHDTIIVTTVHSQIYIGMLFVPETLKIHRMEFKTLGEPLHIDSILGLSVCSWKPIIMTAAKDQTIRIWNYETAKVELVKKYEMDISVIALHPSGIFVAVGFSDQLRLMEIMLDDLKIMKSFNFPKSTNAVFSHQGHMMAVSYEYSICIVSVFSFKHLRTLKGHNGTILGLIWSNDDKALVSSGADGAVYEWDIETGARVNELVQKGTEYKDVVITNDRSSVYSITNKGILKELVKSDIAREIKLSDQTPLTSIALSRSDLVMFMASKKGHLYNVQVPFMEAGGGRLTNTRFFQSAITNMKITYDDRLLITTTDDGTLVIWNILNNDGRIAPMDSGLLKCADVIIPRTDLIEKLETIASLELRIEQQKMEIIYAKEQGDSFHSEQMREIHTQYCDAINDLKTKNEEMEARNIEEINIITASIEELKVENQKAMLALEHEFHEKIIIEYEKSTAIKKKMDDMREDYEQKLRKSAGCLQDTIESMENDFKKQLQERQELIRMLMKEGETKKSEFVEYCRQVEEDNDRRLVELQYKYKKRLKEEEENGLNIRGEIGVLKKKFVLASKENENSLEEISKLRIEHGKNTKKIYGYEKDIVDLKKEIEDRDQIIRDKDKRVHEVLKKNQEVEKFKQVLQHKINELTAQIEPREREILDKKDIIAEMESELESLQHNNKQLKLQLSELNDKYCGTENELKVEQIRSKSARSQVTKICGDIYQVSGQIQNPKKLKTEVRTLYHRYADDKSLEKNLTLDAEVQSEYLRQRTLLEKMVVERNLVGVKKKDDTGVKKLLDENISLISELNKIRMDLSVSQKKILQMESLLGISKKYMSSNAARQKLAKAVANYEEIERKHSNDIAKLEDVIKTLSNDNQILRNELKGVKFN